jgi:alpha-1,3-rhamnosyltransferase
MCLIYRINNHNIKVFFLDKNTVKYRIHENAISRSTDCLIEEIRKNEQILIFNKYRKKHLNKLNLIDLSVYYEVWLNYKFKGFLGHKATNILHKLSFLHWYLKYLNFKL